MQRGTFPAAKSEAENIPPSCSSGTASTIPLKFGMSKNVLSERVRRLRFNKLLYTLRSKVPKITKMDKNSTLSDAIDYVGELKAEIKNVEEDIERLQRDGNSQNCPHRNNAGLVGKSTLESGKFVPRSLLEVSVAVVGGGTMEVRLVLEGDSEENKHGVSQVVCAATKALESLSFSIVNSNIVRHRQDSLCFWVVRDPEDNNLNIEDAQQRILQALKWHGLYLL